MKRLEDPAEVEKIVKGARNFNPGWSKQDALNYAKKEYCPSGRVGGDECEDAKKDFKKASEDFAQACGTLGIPSGGTDGAIACSWHKERCNCLNKNFDDPDDRYMCSEVKGTSKRDAASGNLGLIDLKAAERKIKYCPDQNAEDTERYEKQLEKAQERVKELKKKLPDTLTKANEAQDKYAEKQNDAARKASDLQKEFAKEMNDIKRRKEGEEQQAVAQMAQAREQMDKLDAHIRTLELNKIDAEVKLGEAKTQIELKCWSDASAMVVKLQGEQMASIRAKMPRGGFHSMMRNVGISDRDAWEKRAEIYYRRCIDSRPTRDMKTAAQNIYESTLRQIDSQISAARQNRFRLEENLTQIMTTNGCTQSVAQPGGFSGESQMCRSLRVAQEEMAQAQQNAYQQQQLLQQEAATAQQQLAQKNQTLQMEYADAQRELNDELARMENLRAYLDLKRQHSSGAGTKKAAEELHSNSAKLRSAASTYDVCCKNGQITGGKCKEVEDYIKSWGGQPAEIGDATPSELDMSPEEPSTQRPSNDTLQVDPASVRGNGVKESEMRLDAR